MTPAEPHVVYLYQGGLAFGFRLIHVLKRGLRNRPSFFLSLPIIFFKKTIDRATDLLSHRFRHEQRTNKTSSKIGLHPRRSLPSLDRGSSSPRSIQPRRTQRRKTSTRNRQAPSRCFGNHHFSLGGIQMSDERDWDETDLTSEIEEERQERYLRRCEDLDWQDENNER